MADGLLPINFIVNQKILCLSETNPAKILLPAFYQEETIGIRFKALKYISHTFPFLQKLNLSGYALQISVGSAGSIKANAITWTPAENNTALEGDLALNTADINTALGSNNEIQLTFEINFKLAGLPYIAQFPITVKKRVALAAALVPVDGDSALGSLEAKRTYAPLNDCPGIVMKDQITGERWFFYIANGVPVYDPIT